MSVFSALRLFNHQVSHATFHTKCVQLLVKIFKYIAKIDIQPNPSMFTSMIVVVIALLYVMLEYGVNLIGY